MVRKDIYLASGGFRGMQKYLKHIRGVIDTHVGFTNGHAENDKVVHGSGMLYHRDLAIGCRPLDCFYPAEEYHQDYPDKNPNGYCHPSPEPLAVTKGTDK